MTVCPATPELDPRTLARSLSGQFFCDGRLHTAAATYEVRSPATRDVIALAPQGSVTEVDACVQAAWQAQRAWARLAPMERGKIVARAGERLAAHAEELARLVALETGKALRTESRGEAHLAAEAFRFYAGMAMALKGDSLPQRADVLTLTRREPLGVVAAILPWNVPLALLSVKAAPALVAGNAVVVKTAEEAPLAALRAVALLNEVLPPGVLNVISGDGAVAGAALVEHPRVAKVTFTGSVETGRIICRNAAHKLIPVTLELGGKSPMIVMDDADLARAIDGAVVGMRFTRQGQSCSAATRLLVHRAVLEPFVAGVKARVDAMVMGDPLDEATDIGTLISPEQYQKVQGYLALAAQTPGLQTVACSALPAQAGLAQGLFLRPVLLIEPPADSPLVREEIFGPVAAILPFDTYEQAIALANDTDYGLAASIWTSNLSLALDAVDRLEAGFVQVNQNQVPGLGAPFGGYKQSGLGKEYSVDAMVQHFTREKTISFHLAGR